MFCARFYCELHGWYLYIKIYSCDLRVRSYYPENSVPHQPYELKQDQAEVVLGWVTPVEVSVLNAQFFFSRPMPLVAARCLRFFLVRLLFLQVSPPRARASKKKGAKPTCHGGKKGSRQPASIETIIEPVTWGDLRYSVAALQSPAYDELFMLPTN